MASSRQFLNQFLEKSRDKNEQGVTDEEIFFRRVIDWSDKNTNSRGYLFDLLISATAQDVCKRMSSHELKQIELFKDHVITILKYRIQLIKHRLNYMMCQFGDYENNEADDESEEGSKSKATTMSTSGTKTVSFGAPQLLEHASGMLQARLNDQLATLIVQYYSTLQKEKNTILDAFAWSEAAYDKRIALEKFSLKLKKFSCLVEHETSGNARCANIPPTHVDFTQCREQVAQSVTSQFFEGSNFDTLDVVDLYRLDNKILSDAFYLRAQGHEASLKTLYCSTERKYLQWLIVYGFGKFSASETQQLFDSFWEINKDPSSTRVKSMLDDKDIPQFPHPFSESSTLVGDRQLIESKPNNFHYLVQCKVCLNNVCEVSSIKEFSKIDVRKYDAVYDTASGEYLVYNPKCVLPELLIIYQFHNTKDVHILPENEDWRPDGDPFASKNSLLSDIHKRAQKKREQLIKTIKEEFSSYYKDMDGFARSEQQLLMKEQEETIAKLKEEIKFFKSELQQSRQVTAQLQKTVHSLNRAKSAAE